jgi:hypothetical protein
MLRLAGEDRLPTVGLAGVLIRLSCVPEEASDPSEGLDAYQRVYKMRKTAHGGRLARDLEAELLVADSPASRDVAESQVDNVLTAASLAWDGEQADGEMVDDVAHLLRTRADRVAGPDPDHKDCAEIPIAESVLSDMAGIQEKIERWLISATEDEMADAVSVAVDFDSVAQKMGGGRDGRGEAERWHDIGRLAPFAGVRPRQFVAVLDLVAALQDCGALTGLDRNGAPVDPAIE